MVEKYAKHPLMHAGRHYRNLTIWLLRDKQRNDKFIRIWPQILYLFEQSFLFCLPEFIRLQFAVYAQTRILIETIKRIYVLHAHVDRVASF